MFAFSQSSSVGATASPTSSYQGEGGSPVLSPGAAGRKRQILHDDRELSEIKRRMWGLRFEEEEEAMASDESDADVKGPAAAAAAAVVKAEEEGEGGGDETPMIVRSDSQESAASVSSSSSTASSGGAGRIDGDDPRAIMLRSLYQRRRVPQDRAEAKIENLIRASLRRASAGGGPGSSVFPLALCDTPWRDVEEAQRAGGVGGNGGNMDTSPDPSDFAGGPVAAPSPAVAAALASSSSFLDDEGMDL